LGCGLNPGHAFGSILGTSYSSVNNYNEATVRGDYNLNDRTRISARMFITISTSRRVGGVNAVQSNVPDQPLAKLMPARDMDDQSHVVEIARSVPIPACTNAEQQGLKYASNGGKGCLAFPAIHRGFRSQHHTCSMNAASSMVA